MYYIFPVLFGSRGAAVSSELQPLLDFDFATTKTLDSRISFTRASTATYVNSSGLIASASSGTPRFTHNPISGTSLGILVEEAKTNLMLRSEEFDVTPWSKTALSVTANATTAPDGNNTADKIVESNTSADHYISQGVSTGAVQSIFSVFLKAAERSWVIVQGYDVSNKRVWVNLANGTIGNTDAGVTAEIVAYPNGWYRVSTTRTAAASPVTFALQPSTGNGVSSYLGDGTSGFYAWGAQVETGGFSTSYIPTTSATVTRAADVVTMTGTNFTDWFNFTQGTYVLEASVTRLLPASNYRYPFFIGNATNTETLASLYITNVSSQNRAYVINTSGGIKTAEFSPTGNLGSNAFKIAVSYASDSINASINGGTVSSDTTVTLGTPDRVVFGGIGSGSGSSYFGAPISRFRYYNQALPAKLQTFST